MAKMHKKRDGQYSCTGWR